LCVRGPKASHLRLAIGQQPACSPPPPSMIHEGE
jgi:hypothetical protein